MADPLLLPAVYGTDMVLLSIATTVPMVGAEGSVALCSAAKYEISAAESARPKTATAEIPESNAESPHGLFPM